MSATLVILGMALVTYLPRFAGLSLSGRPVSPFVRRFLRYVPIAVFAALITPALPGAEGEWGVRLVAAAVAGAVFWRTRNLFAGLALGMALFWLLR